MLAHAFVQFVNRSMHCPAIVYNYSTSYIPARSCLEVVDITTKASPENVENAIAAYVSGEAAQKCAPRFGVDGKRLTIMLRERGLLRSIEDRYRIAGAKNGSIRHAAIGLPDEEISRRYLDGDSELALSVAYSVTRAAIATSLRITGTPRRTFTDAMHLRSSSTPLHPRKIVFQDHPGPYVNTWEQRCEAAQKWESAATAGRYARASDSEIKLATWIEDQGLKPVRQQAVGPYNIDIGAYPVAVEVWGGAFHFSRDHSERFRYLFDRGWHIIIIVYVDSQRSQLGPKAAEYIVSLAQSTRSDPSFRREYRVIWGNGEIFASSSSNDHEITRIVPRKRFAGPRT